MVRNRAISFSFLSSFGLLTTNVTKISYVFSFFCIIYNLFNDFSDCFKCFKRPFSGSLFIIVMPFGGYDFYRENIVVYGINQVVFIGDFSGIMTA